MSPASKLLQIGADFIGFSHKALLILHDPTTKPKASPLGTASPLQLTRQVLDNDSTPSAVADSTAPQGARRMEVQYNPATIAFSANADAMPASYLQSNIEAGVPNQLNRPPSVMMRVDLFFDAMNVKDAFMLEKFRLASINDVASSIAGIVKACQDGYSVQPQTNGLLSAMLSETSRTVTFQWADLSFTGELTEANAEYLMFSVSGQPIRSKITLQITQEVADEDSNAYWNAAFDKCFCSKGGVGGKEAKQKVGGLLNLNAF